MLNRITLCTIGPLPTDYEKELLSLLQFDLKTLEEKGETSSIILPPHLSLKQGDSKISKILFYDGVFFGELKVMTISHSMGRHSDTISFQVHDRDARLAIQQLRKIKTAAIMKRILSAPGASGKSSPTTEMFNNDMSQSDSNLIEPNTASIFLEDDRSECQTPFQIVIDGVDDEDQSKSKTSFTLS